MAGMTTTTAARLLVAAYTALMAALFEAPVAAVARYLDELAGQ